MPPPFEVLLAEAFARWADRVCMGCGRVGAPSDAPFVCEPCTAVLGATPARLSRGRGLA